MKTTPCPGGAGARVMVTAVPACRAVPEAVMARAMVWRAMVGRAVMALYKQKGRNLELLVAAMLGEQVLAGRRRADHTVIRRRRLRLRRLDLRTGRRDRLLAQIARCLFAPEKAPTFLFPVGFGSQRHVGGGAFGLGGWII